MAGEWLAALEAGALAQGLRYSTWAYPLVNAGHLLGVALLVGGIVPLDLRLLGLWRGVPLAPLWRVLTRTAAAGLALAAACGALLFLARATQYAQAPLFLAKMALVAAGAGNALLLHRLARPGGWLVDDAPVPRSVRVAGGVSLAAWLGALVLGRLVGYL
jgi:hypothetical protein